MGHSMPYADFKWIKTDIDVTTVPDTADTGYILEVDLEYPQHLHDIHRDLPLAPERKSPPGTNRNNSWLHCTTKRNMSFTIVLSNSTFLSVWS